MEKQTLKQKVFAIRKEIGVMQKTEVNPFYESKYFDINKLVEHLDPILEKYNVMILQPEIVQGTRTAVDTQLIDMDSDEVIHSVALLPDNLDAQKMGGAITYLRRHTVKSLFFLREVDDDANNASNAKPKFQATGTTIIPEKRKTISTPVSKSDLPF